MEKRFALISCTAGLWYFSQVPLWLLMLQKCVAQVLLFMHATKLHVTYLIKISSRQPNSNTELLTHVPFSLYLDELCFLLFCNIELKHLYVCFFQMALQVA